MNDHSEWDDIHGRLLADAKLQPEYANNRVSGLYGYSEGAEHALDTVRSLGYVKHRTITTVEGLDALAAKAKSVILDRNGTPWVCDGDKVSPWASVCEDPYGGPVWIDSLDIPLPATVLYEPEAAS